MFRLMNPATMTPSNKYRQNMQAKFTAGLLMARQKLKNGTYRLPGDRASADAFSAQLRQTISSLGPLYRRR